MGRLTPPPWGALGAWLFGAAVVGAILLFAAEFTTLYTSQIGTFHTPTTVVRTGPHDSYAMVPIALLTIVLATAVLRTGSRPALLAIGITGLVALLIALLGDLPDTHASGIVTEANGQLVQARSTAGAGMYLETLGAILLIATSGLGFILIGRPDGSRPPAAGAAGAAASASPPGAAGNASPPGTGSASRPPGSARPPGTGSAAGSASPPGAGSASPPGAGSASPPGAPPPGAETPPPVSQSARPPAPGSASPPAPGSAPNTPESRP